jgi:hypothetical protein
MVQNVLMAAGVKRNAPRPNPERKQAANGELGAKGAGSDQPSSPGRAANTGGARCRRSAGASDSPPDLQAGTCPGASRTGSGTGMGCPASTRERSCADAPWQEHGRQRGGEAA